MKRYAMMYEEIALAPWGGGPRRSDPFQLGDTGTYDIVDNDLSGVNGVNARFGLFSAITKVVADNIDNTELVTELRDLQQQVASTNSLNDLCNVLERTKVIFNRNGFTIVN